MEDMVQEVLDVIMENIDLEGIRNEVIENLCKINKL